MRRLPPNTIIIKSITTGLLIFIPNNTSNLSITFTSLIDLKIFSIVHTQKYEKWLPTCNVILDPI